MSEDMKNIHFITENQILEQVPPNEAEAQAIADHLRNCESCRQLEKDVSESLTFLCSAPMRSPAPGFTARWKALKAKREAEALRAENLKLLSILGLLIFLTGLMFVLILCVPGNFAALLQKVSTAFAFAAELGSRLGTLLAIFRKPLMWIAVTFSAGMLIYLTLVIVPALLIHNHSHKEGSLEYAKNK